MRSVASKTPHKLQLDLPLEESRLDPSSSVCSLSPASPSEAINPEAEGFVTVPDAGQIDRPVSFPIEPELVVATILDESPRETEPSLGTHTDPHRNLHHSSGRTEQDAVDNRTRFTLQSLTDILDILRHLDAAEQTRGTDRDGHATHQRGARSTDPARGSEDRSPDGVAPGAPGTSNPSSGITINDRPR